MKKQYHSTLLLSYLFFFILLVLSLLLYQERATAMDAAFQVFCVINEESLAIQVQRFGAAIVQFIPLLLSKMGASTSLVLQSYSAAFVLYPLVFFALAVHLFKNFRMGLSIVLFFLLMQIHTFYWIQSELIQGCVFSLFFLSIYSQYPQTKWGVVGYLAGVVVVVYAHPLAIAGLLFGLAYLFVEDEKYRSYSFWIIMIAIAATLYYKYRLSTIGQYDTKALGMFNGFEERLPHLIHLEGTRFFLKRLLSSYYILLVGGIGLCIALIWQKRWWQFACFTSANIAWLLLILTTYHWGGEQFYIESFYLMLSLFLALPLAWTFWPQLEQRTTLVTLVFSVLILVRVLQIWEAKRMYQERLAWNKIQMTEMQVQPGSQFYLLREEVPMHTINLDWAIPYEMLLLAADADESANVLHILDSEAEAEKTLFLDDGFNTSVGIVRFNTLNERFRLDKKERELKHLE